jgi:hypothetical protein
MAFEYKWNNFLHSQLVEIIKNSLQCDLKKSEEEENDDDDNEDGAKRREASTEVDEVNDHESLDKYKNTFIEHVIDRSICLSLSLDF